MSLKREIGFTLNGVPDPRDGAGRHERARDAARGPRPDRHQVRVRRGRVRRLHHPRRRRVGQCSCLMFAVDCDGARADDDRGPGPAIRWASGCEQAFVERGAVQCGFCTPGMVVQATHLLEAHPHAVAGRDPARHRGQPVPLHRLREDRRRHRSGGRRKRREEARDASDREGNADRQAHPQARCAGEGERQDALHPRPRPAGPAARRDPALDAGARADRAHRRRPRRARCPACTR